jgi:hypothetical protein
MRHPDVDLDFDLDLDLDLDLLDTAHLREHPDGRGESRIRFLDSRQLDEPELREGIDDCGTFHCALAGEGVVPPLVCTRAFA